MHIDPITFAAQVVNFLILVAVLKRFLYRPLLNAMEQREKSFVERQAEMERKQHAAEEAVQHLAVREAELEATRTAALEQAVRDADVRRREYYEAARQAVDAEAEQWHRGLERERAEWLASIRRELLIGVVSVTRKVLLDLASTNLEVAVVECLLQRLASLSAEQQDTLKIRQDAALVHTSVALSASLQAQVEAALRRLCPKVEAVAFQTDMDGLGVEVTWPGYRLGWTAEGYMQEVVSAAGQLLDGVAHVPV